MSYQALARRWRPQSFAELVGQLPVRRALENALSRGNLHPALLFSGTRGVGKTTLGRIVARSLNCEQGVTATPCGQCSACTEISEGRFVDLIEVDAASRTRVDETRELLDNVQFAPGRGRFKVYLIDEVHMLSRHSFNALLKTLEEPPPHVQFLLATTDPQKLPVTILSRCLQFHLTRIPAGEIADRLKAILDSEKIQWDEDGIVRLARAADGSLRDALSLLDQAIAYGAGAVRGEDVAAMLGSIERRDLRDLLDALAAGDAAAAWKAVEHIDEQGLDFAEALDELARMLQRCAVLQLLPDQLDVTEADELRAVSQAFSPPDVQVYYQIVTNARRDLNWAPDPRSGFEMCLLRLFAFLPDGQENVAARPAVKPVAAPGPEPVAAVPPATAGGGATGNETWQELIASLQLRGPTLQLALHCVIERTPDGGVVLVMDEAGQGMRTANAEARLCEAVSERLGAPVEIRTGKSAEPVATPAREQKMAEHHQRTTAEEEFLSDPTVRQVAEEFGAEVAPGTVKPVLGK